MANEFKPVLTVLELPCVPFTKKELELFFWKCSYYGGVEAIGTGTEWERNGGWIPQFLKQGNLFDLTKLNPKWLDNLLMIRDFCSKYGMKLYNSPFGGCEQRPQYKWSPWMYNVQGIKSVYDMSSKAIQARNNYLNELIAVVGADIQWGLINEYMGDYTSAAMWAYELAKILWDRGCWDGKQKKLWISGYHHKICGALSDEKPNGLPAFTFPNDGHICIYHGIGRPENIVQRYSAREILVGFSDDGCNLIDDTEARGYCETVNGKPTNCGPNAKYRIYSIKQAHVDWTPIVGDGVGQKNGKCWKLWEVLPRELQVENQTQLERIDLSESLKPFVHAYRQLYGHEPKNWHKYPKPK
jgi:hypothetical protein